jgi:hypothetical protein
MKIIEPITFDQIPDEWIEERREVIARDGFAVRACAASNNIEVQSQRTGEWMLFRLPGNSPEFALTDDRNKVLELLWGKAPLAKPANHSQNDAS